MALPDHPTIWDDLLFALPFVKTIEDMGVQPVHWYRVFGKCSIHGGIQTTWDLEPTDNDRLICGQCHDMVRRCPIVAFTECERPRVL